MFERFTPAARQVVVRAQDEARDFAHPWLGTEHLLLGVLAQSDTDASAVLIDLGITLDSARATLGQLVGRGGFCERDAAALRTVGIDLDQVRHAAEASFGLGTLDRPPAWRCRRGSWLRRRRPKSEDAVDYLPFMPRAKRALERARHEVTNRRSQYLDVDHLLLGLLDPKGNMATEVLRRVGVDPNVVATQLRDRLRDAA